MLLCLPRDIVGSSRSCILPDSEEPCCIPCCLAIAGNARAAAATRAMMVLFMSSPKKLLVLRREARLSPLVAASRAGRLLGRSSVLSSLRLLAKSSTTVSIDQPPSFGKRRPSQKALCHMMPQIPPHQPPASPLARKLAARIVSTGPISLHDYMEACLSDPDHGYYRKRHAIGLGGDFITAPEISQVFGELIGLWAGEVWRQMGEPASVRLVELGPGRGTLMADALRALRVVPGFLEAVSVHLVETSQPLREAQGAVLAPAAVPLFWHEDLARVPDGPVILIANEFFDCLPVRQFVFDAAAGGWRERMVAFEDGAFGFALNSTLETPENLGFAGANEIEDGVLLEQRPGVPGIMKAFAARSPFAALIIDYGYSRASFGDTVQAVKGHRFAGVFDAPGDSDLTAHVDFVRLKQAADAPLRAFGPMPMGEWLLRLGLEARVSKLLSRASEVEAEDLRTCVARLIDPAQMGVLFKVLALTNGISMPPPPF